MVYSKREYVTQFRKEKQGLHFFKVLAYKTGTFDS